MNRQLREILEAYLKMSRALNDELLRLSKTDQFSNHPECLQLIENLRGSYMEGMQILRAVEHRIVASGLIPPPGE